MSAKQTGGEKLKYEEKLKFIKEKIDKNERIPIKDYAIYLRANQTYAEMILFSVFLKKLPIRFKRQGVISDTYIADFVCQKLKLIIEIDGNIHTFEKVYKNDIIRQNILEQWGYKIIRISEGEVLGNINGVAEYILRVIRQVMTDMNFDMEYIDSVCSYENINNNM